MAAGVGLLSGKIALVTGASSGIGRAVCQAFAREGARLAAVDNQKKGLESILSLPGNHQSFIADVSSSASVQELIKEIKNAFNQPPQYIINCAGITRDGFLLKMKESAFDEVINVNLKGTFLTTQAFSQYMIEKQVKSGAIVNISSIVSKVGNIGQCNYAASKAGVIGFTKTAAKELARYGIRCNVILPGFIDTPMVESIPEKVTDMIVTQIPLGRIGKPSEIAEACVFLASDKSSYITGASLEVTGGMFM